MECPVKWVGGKRNEIKHFQEFLDYDCELYVEPFLGSGAVFWHLEPKKSVLSDVNPHLVNFFHQLKDNYESVQYLLNGMPNTKDYYNASKKQLNSLEYGTDVEWAAIFYYLNRNAFGGNWRVNSKGKFNSGYASYEKPYYKSLDERCSHLLTNTTILNEDFRSVLERYEDDSGAFVFVDPPYLDCDLFYTSDREGEIERIYQYLSGYIERARCKVMIVVKETDLINKLFERYIVKRYSKRYVYNAKSDKVHNHVVIVNR